MSKVIPQVELEEATEWLIDFGINRVESKIWTSYVAATLTAVFPAMPPAAVAIAAAAVAYVIITELDIDLEDIAEGFFDIAEAIGLPVAPFEPIKPTTFTGHDHGEVIVANEKDNGVFGLGGDDTLRGESGNDTIEGGNGSDSLFGGTGNDALNGGSGADLLVGGSGRDVLDGGFKDGVADAASYFDSTSGVIVSLLTGLARGGHAEGDTLANVENLVGSLFDDRLDGNDGANVLAGSLGNDTLIGRGGDDVLMGDGGDDILSGDHGNDELHGGFGNDDLHGGSDDDRLFGDAGNDILYGAADDDELDGGAGYDELDGGIGNDTLRGGSEVDTLRGGQGSDALDGGDGVDWASFDDRYNPVTVDLVNGTAVAGTETDTLIAIENAVGTQFADTFIGNGYNNVFDGHGGGDTMVASLGNDIFRGLDGIDTVDYSRLTDLSGRSVTVHVDLEQKSTTATVTIGTHSMQKTDYVDADNVIGGVGNDTLKGNSAANTLSGGAGGDVLDGRSGADDLYGGAGDDVYHVDHPRDRAIESVNEGIDTVISSVDFGLDENFEHLILTGLANTNGIGNARANRITGNSGNNLIDGGAGSDIMSGGMGDDTYVLDNALDEVIENPTTMMSFAFLNYGIDTIRTSLAEYSLADLVNIENLTGTATTGQQLTGNAENNVIAGGAGNDSLNGGAGNDTLTGGDGLDTALYSGRREDYSVTQDGAEFFVRDLHGGSPDGSDRLAGVEFVAFADQTVTIIDVPAPVFTASADAVTLLPNGGSFNALGGNDVLNYTGGVVTADGGSGSDTFDFSGFGSAVRVDLAGGGWEAKTMDRMSLTGGTWRDIADIAGIENLTGSAGADDLRGTNAANRLLGGSGNDLLAGRGGNDFLAGNDGNDRLSAGAGNDTLYAGNGNDLLYAEAGNDILKGEAGNDYINAASGNDKLFGGAHNDKLYGSTGNDALYGENGTDLLYGGTGNDKLSGGSSNDKLFGDAGNDYLFGGLGRDTIYAGAGRDSIVFDSKLGSGNIDTLVGFSVRDDTIRLENAIFDELHTGKLYAGNFHVGRAAHDANDHIIYNASTGALIYDANGNASGGAVQFATLSKGLALSSADFLVI
ncbi:MAG: calcium-binding protein [Xanthobacteraceae bacterium]